MLYFLMAFSVVSFIVSVFINLNSYQQEETWIAFFILSVVLLIVTILIHINVPSF